MCVNIIVQKNVNITQSQSRRLSPSSNHSPEQCRHHPITVQKCRHHPITVQDCCHHPIKVQKCCHFPITVQESVAIIQSQFRIVAIIQSQSRRLWQISNHSPETRPLSTQSQLMRGDVQLVSSIWQEADVHQGSTRWEG